MNQELINIVKEFGLALVERQHQFFVDEEIDNSEHVPAIKRIADAAYKYLTTKGVSPEIGKKVKKELINHGKELFVKEWVNPSNEDEKFPDEENEARITFDELLKQG